MQSLSVVAIAGNHERQLLTLPAEELNASDAFTHEKLGPERVKTLSGRKPSRRIDDILLVHGSPASDLDYLLEDIAGGRPALRSPAEVAAMTSNLGEGVSLLLCGHTHIPRAMLLASGVLVVNPGSVGLPAYDEPDCATPHRMEAGTPHARYAILSRTSGGWCVDFHLVDYDWRTAAEEARRADRPDWAYALLTGFAAPPARSECGSDRPRPHTRPGERRLTSGPPPNRRPCPSRARPRFGPAAYIRSRPSPDNRAGPWPRRSPDSSVRPRRVRRGRYPGDLHMGNARQVLFEAVEDVAALDLGMIEIELQAHIRPVDLGKNVGRLLDATEKIAGPLAVADGFDVEVDVPGIGTVGGALEVLDERPLGRCMLQLRHHARHAVDRPRPDGRRVVEPRDRTGRKNRVLAPAPRRARLRASGAC